VPRLVNYPQFTKFTKPSSCEIFLLYSTCDSYYLIAILLQILVYPPSSHVSFSNIFLFVVNKITNDVIGYTVTDTKLTDGSHDTGYYPMESPAQLLWRVQIPHDQQIINLIIILVMAHYCNAQNFDDNK